MEDKLYKIALKVSKFIKSDEIDTILQEFIKFIRRSESYSPYFISMDYNHLFKIVIYLYSIKNNSPELINKILNNLEFISFIITQKKAHIDSCEMCNDGQIICDNCGGAGYDSCDNCNGSGELECGYCDGDGTSVCPNCEGSGEINDQACSECNGSGQVKCEDCIGTGGTECDDCDGSGDISCNWCGGDGRLTCDYCEGSAEVESEDEVDYDDYFIASWNPKLNKIAKDLIELEKPFMDVDEFFEKYDDFVVLSSKEDHGDLEELDDDVVYFFNITDNPELRFNKAYFYILKKPTQFLQNTTT